MGLKLKNNASSTLSVTITEGQTTIALPAGHGARFPALAAGDWFPLALFDAAGNVEYLKATARNGDSLTVLRAQEGSQARSFIAGSAVVLSLSVEAIAALEIGAGPLSVSIGNSVVAQ